MATTVEILVEYQYVQQKILGPKVQKILAEVYP